MTKTETVVRRGMESLLAETAAAASPPPLAAIERRARAGAVRRHRPAKVVAAVVAATVATTGAAAAGGIIPAPVESMLDEFRTWGFDATEGAERMASTESGTMTYELWRAPLGAGGLCVYVRVVGPDGDVDHGGGSSCHPTSLPAPADDFRDLSLPERVVDDTSGSTSAARLHSVASGQLPASASEVAFEFADGSTLTVAPQRDGYFVTTFPGIADGTKLVAARAVDARGRTVGDEVRVAD